jgi:hypothetical protein
MVSKVVRIYETRHQRLHVDVSTFHHLDTQRGRPQVQLILHDEKGLESGFARFGVAMTFCLLKFCFLAWRSGLLGSESTDFHSTTPSFIVYNVRNRTGSRTLAEASDRAPRVFILKAVHLLHLLQFLVYIRSIRAY